MNAYQLAQQNLRAQRRTWLITGVAGFIGSNLLEALLRLDQEVVGLDNFATGHRRNLEEIRSLLPAAQWQRFRFIEGDICALETCRKACESVDVVLHQAALGSVPRSIDDPIRSNDSNVSGFLHMLVAARDARIDRFIYAASSSTYGDHPDLPKVEDRIGKPLSPYAVTKLINELYAEVFARVYGLNSIGLRYFNVFGPRQDPAGAYAAVIPRWFTAMLRGERAVINGDGSTSRDFCYIENCVQANILAATVSGPAALNQVYNVACGQRTTLSELFGLIRDAVHQADSARVIYEPVYREFRAGDVLHSLADIGKAERLLGYEPECSVKHGLQRGCGWYLQHAQQFDATERTLRQAVP